MPPLPAFERVHAPLTHWAAQRPQALALADEHGALDFATLQARVRDGAAMLDAIGAPGHRLINPDASTREQLVDVLATIASGRCAAVGDPDWPTAVRDAVVQQLAALPAAPSGDGAFSPFYIGYTSGSTGQPKGFRRHHRSWTESFRACVDTFGPDVCGTVLAPGRVSHSLFLFGMLLGLWTGAGSLVQQRHSAARTLASLADGAATVLVAVPSQLLMLLNLAQRRALAPITATRMVLISGAPWARSHTPALQALFPNARLIEFYGASETSFIAWQVADVAVPAAVVGRPFDGVEIEIRDRLQADDPTSPGRIHVRSAMLFSDYVGTPDPVTAAVRTTDAGGDWLSVRDQGRLDEHGRLWLHGRENRMLVTQGKNLFPEEVEAVLEAQPGVAAASVLGLPDAVRGKRVVAVLMLDETRGASDRAALIARLSAACRDTLEGYKRPRRWWIADAPHWPQTRSGKTDHAALTRALDVAEGSEPPWLHATS
ncbi:AMP-binding protein [Sphaerotilus mobilis]|uniref:Long-chain acyl-CoA synthetase n=1 Tax=Sphaerotilus mobilis TaxID=47994 RepID=A0A4Q7LDV1_9BURK|nr:AMP-binding protein [Sphaerotilus mobilis]RZS52244.1 long-chain acyl-CoA synthetase [Sphaerotilus mobilis]